MQFYVIDPHLDDRIFAYGQEVFPRRGDLLKCEFCGSQVSGGKWLPPLQVKLSKPSYGDFVVGKYFTLLVSQRVKDAFEASSLRGITNFEPVEIVKINRRRDFSPLPPQYYHVTIVTSRTRIDEERSKFVRTGKLKCKVCMDGTTIKSMDGLIVREDTWTGEDLFFAENLHDTILVSQRFYDFVEENNFSNARFIPAENYIAAYAITG